MRTVKLNIKDNIYQNVMFVLESFKEDIKKSSGVISQQTNGNNYFNSDYQTEIKKEVDVIKSTVTLDTTKSTILVTIGGV